MKCLLGVVTLMMICGCVSRPSYPTSSKYENGGGQQSETISRDEVTTSAGGQITTNHVEIKSFSYCNYGYGPGAFTIPVKQTGNNRPNGFAEPEYHPETPVVVEEMSTGRSDWSTPISWDSRPVGSSPPKHRR